MSEERSGSRVNRVFNPETQGAVTKETTLVGRLRESAQIKQDIEEEQHPGKALEASKADVYGGTGKTVSIEGAAETQLRMQKGLDDKVTRENLGESFSDGKLPPCIQVKKGES